jgi:chemotaxis protein MotA
MFQLIRIARTNPVELDQHIEDPGASSLFGAYPRSSPTARLWR